MVTNGASFRGFLDHLSGKTLNFLRSRMYHANRNDSFVKIVVFNCMGLVISIVSFHVLDRVI